MAASWRSWTPGRDARMQVSMLRAAASAALAISRSSPGLFTHLHAPYDPLGFAHCAAEGARAGAALPAEAASAGAALCRRAAACLQLLVEVAGALHI